MYTQNSISSLVAQFLRLQKNALEIINGLNQVATSTNDNVEIQLLDEFGFPTTSSIPAYGYLRSQIQRLDSNIEALAGLGQNFSTIRNPDGTYSQIYKVEPLRDPLPLVGLPVPSTFATRDNWFYESFLSPLLYINVDVTGQIPDAADRILLKRIIANTTTEIVAPAIDTAVVQPDTLVANTEYKFLIKTYSTLGAAVKRYQQLLSYGNKVGLQTSDSISYQLYISMPASALDTTQAKDSLRVIFNPKGTISIIP